MGRWLSRLLSIWLVTGSVCFAESVPLAAYNYPMLMAQQPLPGKGNGFVIDLVRAAFAAGGREVDLHYFPTRRALHMGVTPEFAGVVGAVEQFSADELTERTPVVISFIELKLFHRRDNRKLPAQFLQLSDLQGLQLSAVLGSAALPLFEAAKLQYETSPEVDNCISKLALQRIDVCASVEVAAWEALRRLHPNEMAHVVAYAQPLLTYQLAVLLNRRYHGVAEIQAQLSRGLQTIQRNGQYRAIAARYYGDKVPAKLMP